MGVDAANMTPVYHPGSWAGGEAAERLYVASNVMDAPTRDEGAAHAP